MADGNPAVLMAAAVVGADRFDQWGALTINYEDGQMALSVSTGRLIYAMDHGWLNLYHDQLKVKVIGRSMRESFWLFFCKPSRLIML